MTTYIADTFTGADGTQLASHTPGTGGAYVMIFGSAAADVTIQSNRLRRNAVGAGSRNFYNNAVLPANDFYVEMTLRFASNSFCELELARVGSNYSNSDKFVVLDFNSTSSSTLTPANEFNTGGAVSTSGILTALNTDYVLRIEFAASGGNTVATYKIDGTTLATRTATGIANWFSAGFGGETTLGFNMFDSSGVDVMSIDSLTVAGVVPPPPTPDFWTSFVGSHEVP